MESTPAVGGVTSSLAAGAAYEAAKSYLDGLESRPLGQEQLAERVPLVDGAERCEHRAEDRADDGRQVVDDRQQLVRLTFARWRLRAHEASVRASTGNVDADGQIVGRAA